MVFSRASCPAFTITSNRETEFDKLSGRISVLTCRLA
jgi:hypothetical protein